MIEAAWRDLRYAGRMFRKNPGFTILAAATLAAGIGVNTAVFSVVDALLLKPLPYPQPDRLATIRTAGSGPAGVFTRDGSIDGPTFLALRDNAKTVRVAVQGAGGWGGGVNLVADDHAANVVQGRVSAGYFGVLGTPPLAGREFSANEDRAGGEKVAVLAHSLWVRVFARDPGILGRRIMLRGDSYAVIGVMPPGFTDGSKAEVWTPLAPSASGEGQGTNYTLIARLRDGIRWEQGSAEMAQIASPVFQAQFQTPVTCSLVPLQVGVTSDIRQPLLMLWGAVGLVLVIACVNVAGLLLARAGTRTREIATRLALGSGRGAVLRQLLVESGLLALLGGVSGIVLGWFLLDALKTLGRDVFSVGYPIALDGRVLAASLAIAAATSVFFGLVPALHATRLDVQQALAESGTRSVARGGGWSRRVLVVGEVAMGVVLLVSAGLLVRTFTGLQRLSPGFDASGVVTATVSLQDSRYKDAAKVSRLFEETLSRIRETPGVEAAGVTLGLPYTRLLNLGFRPLDGEVNPATQRIANLSYVTPGYFQALRVPVRAGRDITSADRRDSAPIAVVNEEFTRRYYDRQGAMGRHIQIAGAAREIVGIVGNIRTTTSGYAGYSEPLVTPPIVYVPATQVNASFIALVHTWFSPSWVVRSSGSLESTAAGIREAITASDRMLPISKLEGMARVQAASLAPQRFMMSLVAGLGAVALLLAAIGIHGLIASSVTERTRELGVRLALGATHGQALKAVVVPGLGLVGAGLVIGSLAALAAVRLLEAFLWGVTATDPITYAAVVTVLLGVALVASLVPAWRILRLDPALTLRAE